MSDKDKPLKEVDVEVRVPLRGDFFPTHFLVKETDGVSKIIEMALKKTPELDGSKNDYVLKAVGLNDYMDGSSALFQVGLVSSSSDCSMFRQ